MRQAMHVCAVAVLAIGFVAAPPAQSPVPPDSVARLIDLAGLPLLTPGVTCRQFASTDPTGRGEDHGHFLRRNGDSVVLAEMEGPGVVTRLWSANAMGRLRVFLDGEAEPRLEGPFQDLFTGKLPPFCEPIATHRSGGWISYFPIPYARSCRIEVAGLEHPGELYYQVQYLTYPAGTPMRTFTRVLPDEEMKALVRVCNEWRSDYHNTDFQFLRPPMQDTKTDLLVPANGSSTIECPGPGTIFFLGLRVGGSGKDGPSTAALRRGLVVEIAFDGAEPTVRAPIAALCGSGFGGDTNGLLFHWHDRSGTLLLPMPFRKQARLRILNSLDRDQSVEVETRTKLVEPAAEAGTLHAEFRSTPAVGDGLYEFAHVEGPGKFVGIVQALQGVGDLWYLEGNEQFHVDGEQVPSILGTGTEDFYNGGWYWDQGTFQLPLHGLSEKAEWTTNRTAPWRMLLPDAVPFRTGLIARIEHGSRNEVRDAYYSSVCYWYGPPRPVREIPREELREPRLPVVRPKGFVAAAALAWDPQPAVAWNTWEAVSESFRGLDRPLFQAFPVSYLQKDAPAVDPRVAVLPRGEAPLVYTAHVTVPYEDRYVLQLRGRQVRQLAAVIVDGERIAIADPGARAGLEVVEQSDVHARRMTAGEHTIGFVVGPRPTEATALDCLRLLPQAPFVRTWWIGPPVPARAGGTVEDDMPEEARFLAADFSPAAAGWKQVTADGDSLDLNHHVSPRAPVLGYLWVYLQSPKARVAHVRLGSDDGVRVWANGALVWSHAIHRPLSPGQDEFDLPLQAGWNRLLLKVKNDDGGYGVCLQISDPDGDLRCAHEVGGR